MSLMRQNFAITRDAKIVVRCKMILYKILGQGDTHVQI